MRFGRITRGVAVASLAAGAWVAGSALVFSQDSTKTESRRESAPDSSKGRASGVILKVEPIKSGASNESERPKGKRSDRGRNATHRVTINTNDVWRDWVRDQSLTKVTDSPKKDAEKGKKSVATLGEPASPNSLVVIDVGPDTLVETRFRAADDETSKGTTTPPDSARPKGKGKGKGKRSPAKAAKFSADDLKAGLFVEVDYRTVDDHNPATTVSVIRPVGGPDSGSADQPR